MRYRMFFAVLLLLVLCVEGRAQVPVTLPMSERPRWLGDEGLVMAGSWEPLLYRVRRDGSLDYTVTPQQRAGYQQEHSQEMIDRLKALGVNFIMTHCYKGAGLKMEHQGMAEAVEFSRRCHASGVHVGVYTYSGAFLFEPMFKEVPEAKEWILLDTEGQPEIYPMGGPACRYYWNRNHPGAIEFYKGILRFAVEDIRTDLAHLDNFERGPGYDLCSQERFREYLARQSTAERLKQMGVEDLSRLAPPGADHPNAMLWRAWQDFRCQSMAESYWDMSRYARRLRSDVLMECNPGGLERRITPPVDLGRLMQGGEAIWSEGFGVPWHGGRLQTVIPTYKLARRMNNMVFRYVRTPLQAAEAMAFNLDCLGCLCWFEYGKITNYPEQYGKPLEPGIGPFVRFYRERRELFRDASVVADAAVLRSFPSEVFGPPERGDVTAQVEDELVANRVCFQIIADQHLAELDRYRVLVLAGCLAMSDAQVDQVRKFVDAGGRLCVLGPLATHDEWMLPRKTPALDDLPADRMIHVDGVKDMPLAICRALGGEPSLEIGTSKNPTAADRELYGLCTELTEHGNRRLVHLVNYRPSGPIENVVIRLRIPANRQAKTVTLASPEQTADLTIPFVQKDGLVTFVVPKVGVYGVVAVSTE